MNKKRAKKYNMRRKFFHNYDGKGTPGLCDECGGNLVNNVCSLVATHKQERIQNAL